MRRVRTPEAARIGKRLHALEAQRGSSMRFIHPGNRSRRFREASKPYIDAVIFDPLRRRGASGCAKPL